MFVLTRVILISLWFFCLVCVGCACLFVLWFYGPVNPMGSCRARSVYLTTHLLGRLSPLSGLPVLCTFFRQKLTTALLESAEGREWPQKIFHDQSPRKNVADLSGGRTRDLLVSSRTRIQLSHRGRHKCGVCWEGGSAGWECIRKTRPSKYTENFTTKQWKFSDKRIWYFSYFCSQHRLWVLVRTASARRF